MTWKLLTDKRGPLQGVSVEAIVRNAYGPNARFVPDDVSKSTGAIVNEEEGGEALDTVIEMHEVDG